MPTQDLFTNIAGYDFKELLGGGGFGAVRRAVDKLGRDVAIKVLTLESDGDEREASNRQFLKEATTLAKLNHPNIVTLFAFDIDSTGRPYLVMEFVPGTPLHKLIKTGELHLVERLFVILQAAQALHFAHSARPNPVVHRDVKPQNLLVRSDGTLKLIDFGIAHQRGTKSLSASDIAGTFPYMSPEHWQPPVSPWGDVFSLGVVFFELLTGHTPFASEQDTIASAYQKIVNPEPAPLISRYGEFPAGLEEVAAKALGKQRVNSYEDAQEFGLELARVFHRLKGPYFAERTAAAQAALSAGDYDRAFGLVGQILAMEPGNDEAVMLQAQIRRARWESETRLQIRTICDRAEEALLSKHFSAAEQALEEARRIDPRSATVASLQSRLSQALDLNRRIDELVAQAGQQQKSGRVQTAVRLLDEALTLDRANTVALNRRAELERVLAQEHELCVQARAFLDQQDFDQAFELIRRAEALAPDSERVKGLKELAVDLRREQLVREEVDSLHRRVQRFVEAGELESARRELEPALEKYPDQKRLLELRTLIATLAENARREQAIGQECAAAERELDEGNATGAAARIVQALERFPADARLLQLEGAARHRLSEQERTKKRGLFESRARESLAAGDVAGAIITLEMALAEFTNDKPLNELLEQARAKEAAVQPSIPAVGNLPVPDEAAGRTSQRVMIPEASTPVLPVSKPEIQTAAPVPGGITRGVSSAKKGSLTALALVAAVVLVLALAVTYFVLHPKTAPSAVQDNNRAAPVSTPAPPSNPIPPAAESQEAPARPVAAGESHAPVDPQVVAAEVKAALGKGNAHFDQGEYQAAITEYQKGLQGDPYNAELLKKVQDAQSAWETENRVEGSTEEGTQRIRVAPEVMKGMLTNMVKPVYPQLASKARIQGDVVLKAFINADGIVQSLSLVKGSPLLAPSAIEAAKQWRYQPYHIGDRHVPVETTITVKYSLSEQ